MKKVISKLLTFILLFSANLVFADNDNIVFLGATANDNALLYEKDKIVDIGNNVYMVPVITYITSANGIITKGQNIGDFSRYIFVIDCKVGKYAIAGHTHFHFRNPSDQPSVISQHMISTEMQATQLLRSAIYPGPAENMVVQKICYKF